MIIKYNKMKKTRRAISLFMTLLLLLATSSIAEPKGGNVTSGQASIQQNSGTTNINVNTQNAIINWQSFNVNKGEVVNFYQLSSSSRVLNRVNDVNRSVINGMINANGQVYIVNPSGIYFGSDAVINVHSLFAVSGSIADNDFLNGIDKFTSLSGTVENLGSITSESSIHLIGAKIKNLGLVQSKNGYVTMLSGEEVYLKEEGGLLHMNVKSNTGSLQEGTAVSNEGTIEAGEDVNLGSGDLFAIGIANSGLIKGKNVNLDGGTQDTVQHTGTIEASAKNINVTGHKVLVDGKISTAEGGLINIGGSFQGKNSALQNSNVTNIGSNAYLTTGDSGQVIIWSDGSTFFNGSIDAGGGFVEISGKQYLELNSLAINSGTLLLDPTNININAAAPDINGDTTPGDDIVAAGDLDNSADFGAVTSTITAGALTTLLGTTSVQLQATGIIDVNSAVTVATGNTLTLDAATITVDAAIDGPGNVTLLGDTTLTAALGGGAGLGTVTITDTNAFDAGANISATTLNITSNGAITDTGVLTISGTTTLDAGATTNAITLDSANNFGTLAASNNSGVSISNETNGLTLSNIVSNGAISVSSGGTITANTVNGGGLVSFDDTSNGTIELAASADIDGVGVTFSDNVALLGASDVNGGAGTTNFTGTITNGTATTLTLTSGTITLGGNIGDGTALTTLNITQNGGGAFDVANNISTGAITINSSAGNITDTGTLTVSGLTTLTSTGTITLDSASNLNTLSTTAGNTGVSVTNETNGLTLTNIQSGGNVNIASGGDITANTVNTTGSVTMNATSNINLDGTLTGGGLIDFQDNVTLTGNTVINSGANNIEFDGTTNGAFDLTLNSTGSSTFTGAAGGGTALNSLTTNAGGSTVINGGTLAVTNAVTLNDAVVLGAGLALSGSNVTFGSTVNGAFGLNITNTGTTDFNGILGGTTPLTSLTVSSGGAVTTTADLTTTTSLSLTGTSISQNSNMTTGGTLSLSSTAGDINQVSGLLTGSAYNLTSSGNISLAGGTGLNINGLNSITTDLSGNLALALTNNGGSVSSLSISNTTASNTTTFSGATTASGITTFSIIDDGITTNLDNIKITTSDFTYIAKTGTLTLGLIDTGSKDLTLTTQASGAGIFDGNVGAVNIIASSLTVNTSGGNFGTSADPIEFFDPNMPITLNLGGGSSFNLSTQQNNTFVDSSSLSTNIGTMPLTLSSTSSNSSGLELLSDNSPTEGTSLPEALNQGDSSLSSGNFVSTGTLSGDYFSSTDLISLNASFDNFLTTQTEITSAEALVNFLENSTDSSNQQSLNILQRMALSIKAIKNNGVSQDQIDSMAANAAAEFSKDEKKKKLFKQALLVLSEK